MTGGTNKNAFHFGMVFFQFERMVLLILRRLGDVLAAQQNIKPY